MSGRVLEALWIGTESGLEARIAPAEGIPFTTVATGKIRRSANPLKMLSAANVADMARVPPEPTIIPMPQYPHRWPHTWSGVVRFPCAAPGAARAEPRRILAGSPHASRQVAVVTERPSRPPRPTETLGHR